MDKGLINGLDLFSGIGGISLALKPWVRTIAYCERDRYAQGVLLSRMRDGQLNRAPIWDDVRTLRGDHFAEPIDIIFGGFPCQPYSAAARGRNRHDTLQTELIRLIDELKPAFVFAENVAAKPIEDLCEALEDRDFRTRAYANSAASLGAPFIGRRCWAFAQTNRKGKPALSFDVQMAIVSPLPESLWGDSEPEGLRVDDGLLTRLERFRCLGNAVVPIQAQEAFVRLSGISKG